MTTKKLVPARLAVIVSGLCLASCGVPDGEAPTDVDVQRSALSNQDIAFHWAPIHYQSVDVNDGNHGRRGLGDYIMKFNYDDDFRGDNNWDNVDGLTISTPPEAAAYYHVAETGTHWLVSYVFYHPRDWDDGLDEDEHENDMEGAVEIIRKDGSTYGSFEGMATVYHNEWKLFRSPAGNYLTQGPAGSYVFPLRMEVALGETTARPITMQQSQGHGLVACTEVGCGVTTGIRYRPNLVVGDQISASAGQIKDGLYKLIDSATFYGLWANRFDHNLFSSWSAFSGNDSDNCGSGAFWGCAGAAGTPWATSSKNDTFFLFADPAKMVYEHFAGWDNAESSGTRAFSIDYSGRNPLGTPQSFNGQWLPAGADLLTDRAVAATPGFSMLHLFAKLPSNSITPTATEIRYSRYDGATWAASDFLAGNVTTDSAPAALTCNQRMYLFAKTGVGAQTIAWTWKSVATSDFLAFASWATVPSATTDTPVTLACRDAKLYVFRRGAADNRVYFTTLATGTNTWDAAGWREVPQNGTTLNPLAAAVNQNNLELDLVAVGMDKNLWINRLCYGCTDLQWTGWAVHPGYHSVQGANAAWDPVTSPSTGVQLFVSNATKARLDEDAFDGSSWRGPATVRGHQYSVRPPTAVAFGYNLLLFAVGDVMNPPPPPKPVQPPPPMIAGYDQHIWMTAGQPPGRLLSDRNKVSSVSQSPDYGGAIAARAIDGRTDSGVDSLYDGHIDGVFSHGFVTHTAQVDNPYWQIDLGARRTITQVDVFNRTDACCMNRLRNWSIRISDDGVNWTEVFRDDRMQGAGVLTTFSANGPMFQPFGVGRVQPGSSWMARFVRVQINRLEYLHLAEVQVWGF